MKNLLLFFFCTISFSLFAQQAPFGSHSGNHKNNSLPQTPPGTPENLFRNDLRDVVFKYDSIYHWAWDTFATEWNLESKSHDVAYNQANSITSYTNSSWTGSGWNKTNRFNFTYNEHNDQTSYVFQIWNGTFWLNVAQGISTFDGANYTTSFTSQSWDGTAWQNVYRDVYTYDANHNRTSDLSQNWNGSGWDNYILNSSIFDGNNNKITDLRQTWNDIDLTWINSSQTSYTYNGNKKVLTTTYSIWNGVTYDDFQLETNTWNGNDLTSHVQQYWDASAFAWANYTKDTYTYNAEHLQAGTFSQVWNITNWENDERTSSTYDAAGNLTKYIVESWQEGSWVLTYESGYTYNNDGLNTDSSFKNYSFEGYITSGDSSHVFLALASSLQQGPKEDASISVYPNPGHGDFVISGDNEINAIIVHGMSGEQLFLSNQFSGKKSTSLDLNAFGKGSYIVTIIGKDKITNRKIVVQ